MRKRIITAAILLVLTLVGCGNVESKEGGSSYSTAGNAEQSGSVTAENGSEDTADSEEENKGKASTSNSSSDSFSEKSTIEETVLVDEKDVKITVSNLTYGSYSANMDLLIENDSDQDLSFISGSVGYSCNTVNRYAVSSIYVNKDVTAGNKVNGSISISNEELEAYGITDIAEIEIGFQIETTDYEDYMETGPVRIETSSAASYDLTEDTYQKALEDGRFETVTGAKIQSFQTGDYYSSHGVDLISAAVVNDGESDNILLELENTTDQVLRFKIGSFALNNLVISPSGWDSVTLNPGCRGVLSEDIGNMLEPEEYEAFGLGEIAEVAFQASLSDMDYNDVSDEEMVSITFSDGGAAVDDSGEEIYSNNGIRIISKGTYDSDSIYHYLLLTIINDTENTIYVSDEYNSTSVNGFMVKASSYSRTIEPGQAGGMLYGITKSSLEENRIDESEITTVSFQLNIAAGSYYNYIDQPKLTIDYAED